MTFLQKALIMVLDVEFRKGRREKFLIVQSFAIMIGVVGHLEIRMFNGKGGLISDGIFNFVQKDEHRTKFTY